MAEILEVKGELSQVIDYGLVIADLQTKVTADLTLTIDGPNDKDGYKLCDQRRKEWVKVRTGIDKKRKEMNAAAREHIKKVDAVAAEFTELAGQAEDHVTRLVDEIDAAVAAAEKEKSDKFFNDRNAQLLHVGLSLPRVFIESLTDEQLEEQITQAVENKRLRDAESERIAAAKAESDRLAAEQVERNRIEAETLAADRAAFAEQQAEHKAEMERVKAEQQEVQRKLDAAQAAAEKAEAERVAEINRKQLEEKDREWKLKQAETAEAEAIEAEKRAEALRPDREKLLSVAAAIQAVEIPQVSDELSATVQEINKIIIRAVSEITMVVHGI